MRYFTAWATVGIFLAAPLAFAEDKPAAPPPPKDPPAPLCFKLTNVCIERRVQTDVPVTSTTAEKPLNLEVRPQDMERLLSTLAVQPVEDNEPVQVTEAPLSDYPNIPGGPFALFWGLRHPTQAWRIFLPTPN